MPCGPLAPGRKLAGMSASEPFVTYLELRESAPDGSVGAGLSHTSKGLVLLHVLELAAAGEPRGAVTLVHDAGEHGGRYVDVARALAAAGWAVALPDLRGHGKSEGERGHSNGLLEVLRDLSDVQDHLAYRQPDAPKVLVGIGLGALWALAHASEKPESVAGLVLVSPLCEPRFDLPAKAGGLRGLFQKVGPTSPGRTGWTAEQLSSDPAAQAAWRADRDVHGVVTLRAGEEAADAARRYLPRVSSASMPVLVLCGGADPLVPVDRVRALAAPRVDVDVLEASRHDLFHDAHGADAIVRLARWLDTRVPRGLTP